MRLNFDRKRRDTWHRMCFSSGQADWPGGTDMTRRTLIAPPVLLLCALAFAAPASAQQSVTFQVGSFVPRSADARSANDVLLANLDYLWFDIDDLQGTTVGAEWAVALTDHLEVGIGASFYQRTAPAVWADWVDEAGYDLQTDLKLRIAPVSVLAKIHPFGVRRGLDPYVGGGMSAYLFRYSEVGDFVDLTDYSIYKDRYVGSGSAFGPVALAGLRAHVGGRATIGVEGRYQWGEGELPVDRFLTNRIDLGGASALLTFGFRF